MVPSPNHIHTLNIKVIVKFYKVKRVLIDKGSTLNLCMLIFFRQVGYTVADMQNQCITIRSYVNSKRSSMGMINLPIQMGPITYNTLCHTIVLTFHLTSSLVAYGSMPCRISFPLTINALNFHIKVSEITIHGHARLFEYYHSLEDSLPYLHHCPGINIRTPHATSSSSYVDLD